MTGQDLLTDIGENPVPIEIDPGIEKTATGDFDWKERSEILVLWIQEAHHVFGIGRQRARPRLKDHACRVGSTDLVRPHGQTILVTIIQQIIAIGGDRHLSIVL